MTTSEPRGNVAKTKLDIVLDTIGMMHEILEAFHAEQIRQGEVLDRLESELAGAGRQLEPRNE